jgi:hypothetical protein
MTWIGTGGSNPGDVSTNGIITGMGFNSGRMADTAGSPGSWYPVCKISINARYGSGSADILLSIDGESWESNTYGRAQLYLRAKQQNDMSGTLDFVQLISTHLSGRISGSDIVFVKTTDNGSLKEGTLYVRNNVPYTHINYTLINPAGVTVYASETAGGSLPSGTQYALTYGIYDNNIGSIGLGTTDPKGLLQLANSYIVAAAPTGNAETDLANIMAAIGAVGGTPGALSHAGTVYLQGGNYYINDMIDLHLIFGINIIGAGMGTTVIYMNTASPIPVFNVESSFFCTIKNLSIYPYSGYEKTHIGIKLHNTDNGAGQMTVENVEIKDMDTGILLTGHPTIYGGGTGNSVIICPHISCCNTGIQIGESDVNTKWSKDNKVYGGYVQDCVNYGIRFVNGYANVCNGVNINGGGVHFEGGDFNTGANSIVGCDMEGNLPADVRIASKWNKVIDCCFVSTNSIQWDSTWDAANSGNVFLGNIFNNASTQTEILLSSLGIGTVSPNSGLHIAADAGGEHQGYLTLEDVTNQPSAPGTDKAVIYFRDGSLRAKIGTSSTEKTFTLT